MTQLRDLIAEVERIGADAQAIPGTGIDHPAGSALAQSVAREGFPGVLPLWGSAYFTAGLLVRPDLPWAEWPGVVISDGQALTVASDSSTLLPQILVIQLFSDPDAVRLLASEWEKHSPTLTSLHECIGGRPETLGIVVSVASDTAMARSFDFGKDTAGFENAHGAIRRSIDPSPAFQMYADWLDGAIADRAAVPRQTTRFGPWERRVICWANRLGLLLGDEADPPPLLHLWQVVEEFAGVDSGVPVVASWGVEPGEASGESAIVEAAMAIDTLSSRTEDPVRRGLLEALLVEGSAYRGLAHAEAVAALNERGEPERAWGVLQSAAWWAARNAGGATEAIHAGAQLLARSHDWADVLWVLERETRGL